MNSSESTSASSSMTDSPWFWAYLFAIGGLISLALAAPKFGDRQAQEERRLQGRERAAQQQAGVELTGEVSTAENTQVTLRPLFLALAVIASVGWIVFWFKRRRDYSVGFKPAEKMTNDEISITKNDVES